MQDFWLILSRHHARISVFSSTDNSSDSPIMNGTEPVVGNDHLVQSSDPDHPANLIPSLCKVFYDWRWCSGSGGGVGKESVSFVCGQAR